MLNLPQIDIGMTGTKLGWTLAQKKEFATRLSYLPYLVHNAHHGDCIGTDENFHDFLRQSFPSVFIVVHPPTNPKYRAFKKGDLIKKPLPYLKRNGNIIKEAELMFAFPRGFTEELRSGTWQAIRTTRKCEKPLVIIWPDGSASEEWLDKLTIQEKQNELDF